MYGRAGGGTRKPHAKKVVRPKPVVVARGAPTTLDQVQALQQSAGNRAVSRMLAEQHDGAQSRAAVQRVRVDGANSTETILWDQNVPGTATAANGNTETATQQFQPRDFTAGGGHYDMTRAATEAVVEVHIVFTDSAQAGQAIPEGDERRGWANTICQNLVHVWNGDHGRFELVGRRRQADGTAAPPAPAGTPDPHEVRLGVRFVATPVFDVSASASYPRVAVHPSSQTATGSLTNRTAITAGDWFMAKNDTVYPASPESIYAHEYGHLLGIPDEYSQNNPQMHALFHRISPTTETRMNDELDRAASDQLVMMALRPQLMSTVSSVSNQVAAAIGAQHASMDAALAAGLRRAWRTSETVGALSETMRSQLIAAGHQRSAAAVPTAAHFEAYQNLSNVTLAKSAVAEEIDPAHIRAIIQASLDSAVRLDNPVMIQYPGGPGGADTFMNVEINTSTGAQTNAASGPLSQAAAAAATATTTPPAAPAGHRPPAHVTPPNTLIGQLLDLPNQWRRSAMLLESESVDMDSRIQQALAGITFPVDAIGDSVHEMYRSLYDTVQTVSDTVATQTVRMFLTNEIDPIVDDQVHLILNAVSDAVQNASGTNAARVAAANPPDPAIQAAATQMAAQVTTLLNRPAAGSPAGTGTGPAATQTAQDVRYTVQSQMGNNVASDAVRPDQMDGIVGQFNTNSPALRHADEENFALRNK